MLGTIFDIQKSALHDGPGIRTVVFLKGCPLRCTWCANPESQSPSIQLGYDAEKCQQCLDCTRVCKTGALTSKHNRLAVDFAKCNGCGACLSECTQNALKLYGWQTDVQSVIDEVQKDAAFFKRSGGLTLSGGEPLAQSQFAKALLQEAHNRGIHTCVETSGHCSRQSLESVLPLVDMFLFDYKLTNPQDHVRYTGQSNKRILANLRFLNSRHADIILRCIIIPGINDTDEHFRAIAHLRETYESIKDVEILPYHDYGQKKYRLIGQPYAMQISSVSPNAQRLWETKLNHLTSVGEK